LSIIISLVLCHPLFSQNIKNGKDKIIADVLWKVDDSSSNLRCVIIEKDSAGDIVKTFKFYNDNLDSLIYSFEQDIYPLAVYPLNDGSDNLIIISNTVTSTIFSVYSYIKGKIVKVLQSGSKYGPPELVYENKGNGSYSIIVTNIGWAPKRNGKGEMEIAESADIYRWKNGKYIEIPNVPWSKRLNWKK